MTYESPEMTAGIESAAAIVEANRKKYRPMLSFITEGLEESVAVQLEEWQKNASIAAHQVLEEQALDLDDASLLASHQYIADKYRKLFREHVPDKEQLEQVVGVATYAVLVEMTNTEPKALIRRFLDIKQKIDLYKANDLPLV